MTTTYTIERGDTGYYVTDGIWTSAEYPSKAIARKVLNDATWGERGSDGFGTHADKRVSR